MAHFALLPDRGVLALTGEDRAGFLQGLVSNDVTRADADRALFAAFLTPQGKFLFDFFLAARPDALWLETEAGRLPDFLKKLKLYKLRAKVALEDCREPLAVAAIWGADALAALGLSDRPGAARPLEEGVVFADPRLPALGARAILPQDRATALLDRMGLTPDSPDAYDRHRLALGVPDGSRDLEVEKSTLLESNYDVLNAIAWDKGCYMGQELTARTRYRGLVKKRLMPVTIAGPLPAPGTRIRQDGREVGTLRSGRDNRALALLRLEALARADASPLETDDGTRLTPDRPDWLVPDAAE